MEFDCGPLINAKQQRARAVDYGARGGRRLADARRGRIAPSRPPGGFFVAPTLLGDVPRGTRVAQEEVFGPVLVAAFRSATRRRPHARQRTAYGLAAGVWTRDGAPPAAPRAARPRAGQVFINGYGAGGGVELPFGGVKSSGHGREKGIEALLRS